jgi:CubicO group peptidase (beta-lactamase class C family)
MSRSFLAAVLLLGLSAAATRAEDKPDSAKINEHVAKALEVARKKFDVPGMGAIIASSKGVLSLQVEGVRKAGADVKIQPGDKFHLGSDTKAFTALLIAILVQKKVVSYDLTLEKAFPEYAKTMNPSFRKVTLDLLLRHRAGMPNDLPDWWAFSRKGTPMQMRQNLVKAILTNKDYTVKPDEGFSYSNLGYVLATAMVERAAKASWETLLKKHVLGPLKITSAGYGQLATNKDKIDQPWGHKNDGTPVEPGPSADNPPILNPSTRLHMTLSDWAKFAADQLKGAKGEKALLPAEVYKKLHDVPGAKEGEARYTAGGWIVMPFRFGTLLMHDGSNTFYYAAIAIDLKRDYAILVACNMGKKKEDEKKAEQACGAAREELIGLMIRRTAEGGKKEK